MLSIGVARCTLLLLPALTLTPTFAQQPARDAAMTGFTTDGAAASQRALESRFDGSLEADHLRGWMKQLSARPHHVGSPWGKENAEFLAGQFRTFGYEVRIEEFEVLFPTPTKRVLEMVAPTPFRAALAEPPIARDATSGQTADQLPIYNAYSADGDVTGELVYVNYGVPDDYEQLEQRGIDVKGKIVIARYGGSWRGIKPKVAAEHGAIGCLIFSDPHEDGYYQGTAYPDGGWRSPDAAQRGSVMDMPLYPGDPLTPSRGATADAERLAVKEAPTLAKIPVLPISYADAKPLLEAMAGPMAPEPWRGSLPIPYRLGPGPAKVHLALAFDWSLRPIRDVIAVMRGAEQEDEWILRGNHHDAWVNGAADPISGLVAMMEEACAIGALAQSGWRPKRTLVYAAWDGEEPGLLGSTEWAEAHAAELAQKAVVYINSDVSSRGFLDASGSHSLERLVNEVARDVVDPERGVSVHERLRARRLVNAEKDDDRKDARERLDLRIDALGSGSDYSSFLQHLGIAALNLAYGGEDDYGQYHSIYDSFDHYTRFMDVNFVYGIVQAKTVGRVVLRLANADVLPFTFVGAAETIGKYVDEVVKLTDELRHTTEETNRWLRDKTQLIAADARETYVPPAPKQPVPFLNFAPLQNASAQLVQRAAEHEQAWSDLRKSGRKLTAEQSRALDRIFMHAEQALTQKAGLPRRAWYVHQIYAPGWYTGYGVKTLPAVREAIEQRHFDEAEAQIPIVAKAIEAYAAEVERATRILGGSSS
jgi:N-acetylated-alpha-linked acidic dipeptidase